MFGLLGIILIITAIAQGSVAFAILGVLCFMMDD